MKKIFKFTTFSLRDLIVTVAPLVILIVAASYFAYKLINPFPPTQVALSTGQDSSAYAEFGKKYAQELSKFGITTTLKPSQGSEENLRLLKDEDSNIDIAFVQSGSTEHADAELSGLISIGSLFYEPVWLFYRESASLKHLTQLKQMKVNVGPDGSGVPKLFSAILDANNIDAAA